MLFWIVTFALAVAVAVWLAAVMLRPRGAAAPAAAYDIKVYRDQLRELERDRARGLIAAEDADRARTEISRRILDADRQAVTGAATAATAGAKAGGAPKGATLVAAAAGAVILAGSFLLYQTLGVPGYGDLPYAGRMAESERLYDTRPHQDEAEQAAAATRAPQPAPDPKFVDLMDKLRTAVAERPEDTRGLALLAQNEAVMGNFRAAWEAQGRLIAARGAAATADDYAAKADLMALAAGGLITPEAEAVLAEALQRDPANGTARYYLGLMLAQNGRPDRTFRIWANLLDEGPDDAPWIAPIRDRIMDLAWLAGEDGYQPPMQAGAVPPFMGGAGPDQADVDAAAEMTPEQRQEMIRGMVERLNDRLASEGGTPEDWAKLIGALGVLGETGRARAIWDEAQKVFAGHPAELDQIRAAAERAGVAQ